MIWKNRIKHKKLTNELYNMFCMARASFRTRINGILFYRAWKCEKKTVSTETRNKLSGFRPDPINYSRHYPHPSQCGSSTVDPCPTHREEPLTKRHWIHWLSCALGYAGALAGVERKKNNRKDRRMRRKTVRIIATSCLRMRDEVTAEGLMYTSMVRCTHYSHARS